MMPERRNSSLSVMGTGVLNVVDFVLTLYALQRDLREVNPFLALIVDTPSFAELKLVLVPMMLVYLCGTDGNRWVSACTLTPAALMAYYAKLLWRGYL